MLASQPWPLICLTFGKMPSELFRKCAGWTHNYNNAAEQPCQEHWAAKIPQDRKEMGQGNNMAPIKNGNDCIMFLSFGTHLGWVCNSLAWTHTSFLQFPIASPL